MLYGTPTHRWVSGSTGQHRRQVRRHPQRAAQLLPQCLAALIVLGLTTLTGYLIVADTQRHRGADEPPLLRDVFSDAPATYRITMTDTAGDCASATLGDLGTLLADHGCSQVVRAALSAPYGDYQVTAGVFSLADENGAQDVDGRLRLLVETGDGSFATLPSDGSAPATLQVGWRARGHYLLYCVITRPGGRLVTSDDPYASRITTDLVDTYLSERLGA